MQNATTKTENLRACFVCVGLCVLAALVFWPTLRFDFLNYDDQVYVTDNPHAGNGRSDSVGGGHAHCGTMIYQGGTWPTEYHGLKPTGRRCGRTATAVAR